MRFHWQNLSKEDEHGQGRGFPWHGRCWWHIGREDHEKVCLRLEWAFRPRDSAGVSFGIDEEDGLVWHVGLWLLGLWWGVSLPYRLRQRSREVRLKFHGGSLWWTFWRDPMGDWGRHVPRWRQGSFNVVDFLLGKPVYSCREIRTERVPLPLPEGPVPATVVLEEASWARARWFTKRVRCAQVTPDQGAPVPGKGENSWDCGPDAIYSLSCQAVTAAEAVGHFVERVLRTRRDRGAAWDYTDQAGA